MKTMAETLVRQAIKDEGAISVARFMQIVLGHPEHGYYSKGDPLGVAGDFTTAPEISQMFGEMIGLWIAEQWRKQGSPDPFTLCELGAGRGTLLADALRATEKISGFHAAMRLSLLESNETLRALQKEKLALYEPAHVSDLSALPEYPVFFIANEFFDAMPIHQYERHENGWRERLVGVTPFGSLAFAASPHVALLPLPDSALFYELSPVSIAMVQGMAAHIVAHGGAALVVDYGYTEGSGIDTLQAVKKHVFSPSLRHVGGADLSAHVDFMALRLAALKAGAVVPPIIGQGSFLKALGIEVRARALKLHGTLEQADAIDAALHRLVDPAAMGMLFKVMGIMPPSNPHPDGFP